MPQIHCQCCGKATAHKIVMKRCSTSHDSVVKNVGCFFSTLFQGAHYVKMEQQAFCRVCNTQAQTAALQQDSFAEINAA